MSRLADDPRIDPRLKAIFGRMTLPALPDVGSREELIAQERSPEALAGMAAFAGFLDAMDNEELAPSAGLVVSEERFASSPDGNTIKVRFVRPESAVPVACVCYLHGGGMSRQSAYDGNYRAWARMIAANGVAVAMIEFRNSVHPSAVPEVAPYPAGLNDCVAAVRWLHREGGRLGIDPRAIVVAGDSGGGNLALATGLKLLRDGEVGLVAGLYALCPFIAGDWPLPENPSSTDEEGLFISVANNRGPMSYGIEAYRARDPLAWPGMAGDDDVRGLPPTVVSVNECDPLRDEGVGFYRLLLRNGVAARCRQVMGTIHATEVLPACCPDISRDTAAHLAAFAASFASDDAR